MRSVSVKERRLSQVLGLTRADATPQYAPLFTEIANHHLSSQAAVINLDDEPASKRRKKLSNGSSLASHGRKDQAREVLLEARDISFSLPQRKKLHLGIAQYGTDINTPETSFAIFTRNPATNEVDMEVPLSQFAYAMRLPVPEKAAKQYNFVFLPKTGLGDTVEPIIFSVNAGPLKNCTVPNTQFAKIAAGPEDVLESAFGFVLRQSSTSLSLPVAEEFFSATPESHRKGDKAYHVKAFRGSKDGYLFFLGNGIFFGFKKPLAFFAFEDVESVSYTSVLQRTFNLNIAYRASGANVDDVDAISEVEFSMLDQADFPGIDAYVKRHGLQDASLAEARRAKKLTNPKTSTTQNGDTNAGETDEDDDRTELEKAQQQLDDEEDEEEEDYDPGSDDDSEGSGYSDDEDATYDREYEKLEKKTRGKDLVKDELGSEAEDVSITEDEDGDEDEEEAPDEEENAENHEEGNGSEIKAQPVDTKKGDPRLVSIPTHSGGWKIEAGMPDPEDEDQL